MRFTIKVFALLLVAQAAYAQEPMPPIEAAAEELPRQITYCDSPAVSAEMEENLSGFKTAPQGVLSDAAKAGILSIQFNEIYRSSHFGRGGITCIGVAVDHDGVAQGVYVHPKRLGVGRKAERQLMNLQYGPTIIDGEASPSIIVISIANRN